VRLTILHASQPVEAGVPAVINSLVADESSRGHDVHVACPPGAGLAATAGSAGAVHHPWAATRAPGPAVLGETRRIRRIIETVDPDVVVLHSAKAGLAGRLALRGRRPTVYVPHAWSFSAVSGLVSSAATAWEVGAGRWTDLIVCVSEEEQQHGRSVGVTAPMQVVPNGVDVEAFRPRPASAARARLGLPERPTVVCVGRFAEQKGQDLLLALWPAVTSAVPDAQLVLVGDGPGRAAAQASAPASVTFTGGRDDAAEFFAAADVVAVPSRWEGGPLVPLEAMAMGRPVVGFDVAGMRRSLGSTGRVLDAGDLDGFAAALTSFLTDPDAAVRAGRAARARAVRVADVRQTLATWDGLMTTLTDRTRVPAGVPAPRSPAFGSVLPTTPRIGTTS
jgi:glycosyltransferase involved in cell wall biosynthesis